jgi:hypothetical protein
MSLILLFYLKQLYMFRRSLPIIRSSYTAWSAVVYGKRMCGRAVWYPVVSLVWSILPWHMSRNSDSARQTTPKGE